MRNTLMSITLDRANGKAIVKKTSDKLIVGDSSVNVSIEGFETGEIEELVPYIQVMNYGVVCAEAEILYGGSAILNLNTRQLFNAMASSHIGADREFTIRIFATTVSEPIASGRVRIKNFPRTSGNIPINIPSTSEVLQGMKGDKGDKGDRGEKGDAGLDGRDGVSISHEWNGTILAITSATGTTYSDLKGAKGDKGDKGERGDAEQILADERFNISTIRGIQQTVKAIVEAFGGTVAE